MDEGILAILVIIGVIALGVAAIYVTWWALNTIIDWFLSIKGLMMPLKVRLACYLLLLLLSSGFSSHKGGG